LLDEQAKKRGALSGGVQSSTDRIGELEALKAKTDPRRTGEMADINAALTREQNERARAFQNVKRFEDEVISDNERVEKATQRNIEAAKEAARLGALTPRIPPPATGPDSFNGLDKTAAGGMAREFSMAEALMKKSFDNEQKLLDEKHRLGLIGEAAYAFKTEEIAEASYQAQMFGLKAFIKESEVEIARLRGDNKGGKANAAIAAQENKRSQLVEQLEFAKAQSGIRTEGADKKADESYAKEVSRRSNLLALAQDQLAVAHANDQLTTRQIAYYTAENTALASSNEFLREKQRVITDIQKDLDAAAVAGDEPLIARLQKSLADKTAQLDAFKATSRSNAAALGQVAFDAAQPNWEKMLSGFKNTLQLMETAYNEIVEGFLVKGQDIFANIFKTGKLSLSSLLDLVKDVLVKEVYQSSVAPLFASMGKAVAGTLFPQGAPGAIGDKFKAGGGDAAAAAASTTTSFNTLQTTGINPVTAGFNNMLAAIETATAAMLRMGGGGGAGGLGGIGELFKGGSDGTGAGGDGFYTNPQAGYALGGTFGFARGGSFTNSVVHERTPFHFKNGNHFSRGEMGEAGPEAVMPLRRGPDGSLGIMSHGGGGGGGGQNVAVHVNNYSDGKARVQESRAPDGSRVIKVIVDQAVKETARSIQAGGIVGDAVEGQYGVQRANGLPRR
jgi:hypothetical protein